MEWTCVWNRLEMARKAGVPTSQVLVLLQFEDVIDGLWLEWKLVPRGSGRHPSLSGEISGLATMEWSWVWNRLEMARKAGVPTLQVLVLLQFEDVIDVLWLEWKLVPRGSRWHPGLSREVSELATMEWTCVSRTDDTRRSNYWLFWKGNSFVI